ncbi:hypothetical protein AgCh_032916 [Apium graveolens]
MSFFFKPSRPKTSQELVKAIRDSLNAFDTKTIVEVNSLKKCYDLAIGCADSFARGIEKLRPRCVDRMDFKDHHVFRSEVLDFIAMNKR